MSATGDQFSRIKTSKIRKANCFSNSLIIRFARHLSPGNVPKMRHGVRVKMEGLDN